MKISKIFLACLLVCVSFSAPGLNAETEPEIIKVREIWELGIEFSVVGYYNESAFLSVENDTGITIIKKDIRSGEITWKIETGLQDHKIYFAKNGYIVLFDEDHKLICFDNYGTEIWKSEITDEQYKYQPGVSLKIIEDRIYISKYGKQSHKTDSEFTSNLYVIDVYTGEHVWVKQSNKVVTECFAVTDGLSFWGGGKSLYSFGGDGETAWEDYKHCDVVANTPDNCVKGDYLFFGSYT